MKKKKAFMISAALLAAIVFAFGLNAFIMQSLNIEVTPRRMFVK